MSTLVLPSHSPPHPSPSNLQYRQGVPLDYRSVERRGGPHAGSKGVRFFTEDEDNYGLEDLLVAAVFLEAGRVWVPNKPWVPAASDRHDPRRSAPGGGGGGGGGGGRRIGGGGGPTDTARSSSTSPSPSWKKGWVHDRDAGELRAGAEDGRFVSRWEGLSPSVRRHAEAMLAIDEEEAGDHHPS